MAHLQTIQGQEDAMKPMLRIDKFNEIQKPKDTNKDLRGKNVTRGSNMSNYTNVKWAKGTKEGNMGIKVSK